LHFVFNCRSGTVEEYDEKAQLLDGIVPIYREEQDRKATAADTKKKDDMKADADRALGLKIRQDATQTLKNKITKKTSDGELFIRCTYLEAQLD